MEYYNIKAILNRLKNINVVIEYVPFYIEDCNVDFLIHKNTAIKGMQTIIDQYNHWVENRMIESPNLKRNQFKNLVFDANKMEGVAVNNLDDFFNQYKYAFYQTPYGLSGDKIEQDKLFEAINKILFDNFKHNDFEIVSWSDNWSNYFDDGKEWWGTYFFTVYNQRNSIISVIAASSTD